RTMPMPTTGLAMLSLPKRTWKGPLLNNARPSYSRRTMPRLTTASATLWQTRETRSEEHTSELQSLRHLVCRLLLEKKKKTHIRYFKQGFSLESLAFTFESILNLGALAAFLGSNFV